MTHEEKFWMVASAKFPTTISYMHASFESAQREAIRLANQTHQKFYVLEAISSYKTNNVIEEYLGHNIPF